MTIARDGVLFVLVTGVISICFGIAHIIAPSLALSISCAISGFITLSVFWFFRDPDRFPDKDLVAKLKFPVVCPAEGRVADITELGEKVRIGIFLFVWDIHVQYVPFKGTIKRISRKKGWHLPAFYSKAASRKNVSSSIIMEVKGEGGHLFEVRIRQIVGLVARRIRVWVKEGQNLNIGDRLGMIILGSRTEIFLPKKGLNIRVKIGKHVRAGETILADYGEKK
ncbi:phosphatidylserine decarboxylase [Elusimicrobiota bacterium]